MQLSLTTNYVLNTVLFCFLFVCFFVCLFFVVVVVVVFPCAYTKTGIPSTKKFIVNKLFKNDKIILF